MKQVTHWEPTNTRIWHHPRKSSCPGNLAPWFM